VSKAWVDIRYPIKGCFVLEDMMYKDKKTIKREILDKFRAIGIEKDMLPPQWLEADYVNRLDNQEKRIFKKAVEELVTSGLVEQIQGSAPNLKLTRKGVNLIH
jgi:hypothetical protein